MFRWKKRDDGFEWHQYVRTTIKLRREARRNKVQELGAKAAGGARAAGDVAGSAAQSGIRLAGRMAQGAAVRAAGLATAGLRLAGRGLGFAAVGAGRAMAPVLDLLGRPSISGPLVFVGSIAVAAGAGRMLLAGTGLDSEASAALVTGLVCLGCGLGPAMWLGHSVLPSRLAAPFAALGAAGRIAGGAVAVVALAGAALIAAGPLGWRLPAMPGLPAMTFLPGAVVTVEGRAVVAAADLLRIDETTIRLAGIEAPDRDQRCTRAGTNGGPGRSWACGEDARDALVRLARSQPLKCEVGGKDGEGIVTGRCRAGTIDIAEALVRGGHVFAGEGLAAAYRVAEGEARAQKAGVWSSAEPERPATWRARLWAEAKSQAPEGCPIKGRVARGERVYLLPWASDYSRARISKRRGERWFCSEEEAIAAGWRQARRG